MRLIINKYSSAKSDFWYVPFALLANDNILLVREAAGLIQSLVALDSNLNKTAKLITRGNYSLLQSSNLIANYDIRVRETKLYSIQSIPWYERLSPTFIRNITISFFLNKFPHYRICRKRDSS